MFTNIQGHKSPGARGTQTAPNNTVLVFFYWGYGKEYTIGLVRTPSNIYDGAFLRK